MLRWLPPGTKTIVTVGIALILAGPVAGLHRSLPSALPLPGVLKGWERVRGSITQDNGTLYQYELFVDPAHAALYTITHYQVRHPATATVPALVETEKVLWNERPGERTALRLFERIDGRWRAVDAQTPGYAREMMIVIHLYELHRQVVAGRPK